MPICDSGPWRAQYFENVDCPADVFIPTEDSDAWLWKPNYRWVYDKRRSRHAKACPPRPMAHMWMPLLERAHVSSDMALVDGEPQ